LLIAGDHVPTNPLSDVVGNSSIIDPAQYASSWVNVGIEITPDTSHAQVVVLNAAVSKHAKLGCTGCVPDTSHAQVVVLNAAVS
jgi:hypothetical protein